MGVTFKIGEYEECVEDGESRVWVETIFSPYAPQFKNDCCFNNSRQITYDGSQDSMFPNFVREIGGEDLFYSPTGLSPGIGGNGPYPSWTKITPDHISEVKRLIQNLLQKYPNAVPQFYNEGSPESLTGTPMDGNLARLYWFEWWMCYAFDHCRNPIVYCS